MLTPRPSLPEDIDYLAPRLRGADAAELAACGSDPWDGLRAGLASPDGCYTAVNKCGEPVLMFGSNPHPQEPSVGAIWLLGSEEIARDRVSFLRQSPGWVEAFHRRYPVLMNFTDKRNSVHHRWLRWLGFVFLREVPGPTAERLPFLEFARLQHV